MFMAPCRLHRDVCVDDFTFRQPEVQRNISRRHEDWVGLLHDLLKLGNRTLNALFHEPRLRLQVYGDVRRPYHSWLPLRAATLYESDCPDVRVERSKRPHIGGTVESSTEAPEPGASTLRDTA